LTENLFRIEEIRSSDLVVDLSRARQAEGIVRASLALLLRSPRTDGGVEPWLPGQRDDRGASAGAASPAAARRLPHPIAPGA